MAPSTPAASALADPCALGTATALECLPEAAALIALVTAVVQAALPGTPWRVNPATHPYTTDGLEIEARAGDTWVEIGECGVAAPHVVGPDRHGLAIGLGLDRLLMLRKGIDDIRLLRSADPRVSRQMLDLTPYRPVSAQPAARRDLSVALPADVTPEDLGDRVREILGPDAHLVEEVTIESITPPGALPAASRHRLDLRDGEVNVLLRVVLRDLHRALPKRAANALRDRLYEGLMQRQPTGDADGARGIGDGGPSRRSSWPGSTASATAERPVIPWRPRLAMRDGGDAGARTVTMPRDEGDEGDDGEAGESSRQRGLAAGVTADRADQPPLTPAARRR